MLTWETGIAFGRALEQLRSHDRRITDLEEGRRKDQAEVRTIKAILMRGGLVLLLLSAAALTNLPADRVGELVAAVLKSLPK